MIDGYRPELEATPAAREAARFLLLTRRCRWWCDPATR